MKETEELSAGAPLSDLQLKIKPERRAAKIANTKIAESTKILASNKIIATSAPPPPPKPRGKSKQNPKASQLKAASTKSSPAATRTAAAKAALLSQTVTANKAGVTSRHRSPSVIATTTTKTVMVTKKTPATSLLNTATRLIATPTTKAVTTSKITSTIQGKQVTLLTKPLLSGKPGVGGLTTKVPLLVFSQGSGQVQSYIPIAAGSLPPNTLISIAATPKRPATGAVTIAQPKLVSLTPKTVTKTTVSQTPVSRAKKADIGLIMECEDDELSAVQRIACKKAESDYVEMLRKLTKWKKDPRVEVVTIGPNDPIPPVPVMPDVIEASRLPLPNEHDIGVVPMETTNTVDSEIIEMMPKITEIQSGVSKGALPTNQGKETGPISVKAASAAFASRLCNLYGKPKKTLYNTFAASLFGSGNTIEEISSYLNALPTTTQLYLIDSAMCDEPVDCGQLCETLGVNQEMIDCVGRLIRTHHFMTLTKLVNITRYTINQARVCVAALYRGVSWRESSNSRSNPKRHAK